MPSILENLIERTNAYDYNPKGFAMLNCASFLRDSQLEGEVGERALAYFTKIVANTNEAYDTGLYEDQKKLCMQALLHLSQFQSIYKQCLEFPDDDNNPKISPDLLIKEIQKQCELHGFCYLPSGWLSQHGSHYLTLKIMKNTDNSYVVSFLNHGAGINHHNKLGASDEKIKYDYQSSIYQFDLNSDSAKLFFHGILGLQSGAYFDAACDEQDLYGLLALHGQYQPGDVDEKRMVTPQRSGTCTLTNTRVAIKDALLCHSELSRENIKRYEFFNKLASIVTAYKHLMSSQEAQSNESELQLLEQALKELYVRLEKLHPKGLRDDELKEIRVYADEIHHQVHLFQQAILEAICQEKAYPAFSAEWKPSLMPTGTEKPALTINEDQRPSKTELRIRRCTASEVDAYLQEGIDYFEKTDDSPQTFYELIQFMHSLPPTTACEKDPYWDEVPETHLTEILDKLTKLPDVITG